MKKYLIRVNNDFRIDHKKENLKKVFYKITIISKTIYIILINRITIILVFNIYILIVKLKLKIDINSFIYFNYNRFNYVRKNYNV